MLLLPRRLFQPRNAAKEPLHGLDFQRLSSPTASFTSLFEKDEQPSPAAKKTSERTDILLSTSAALDHNDEILHAEEVDNNVHILLFQSLQEAVAESYDSEDVVLSLDSLVKILRCTDDKAREIFVGGGGVSLLEVIFLLTEMHFRLGNARIVSLCKSIIHRFASLKIDLTCMYNSFELLSFLVRAIDGTSGREVVCCASLVLERLSLQLGNKTTLAERRDIIDCLFGVVDSNHPNKTRALAMRTIANLASDAAYANNQVYLGILFEALMDNEFGIQDAAVVSILSLSTDPVETRSDMMHNMEGDLLDRLLMVAEDFTAPDYSRICALRAFTGFLKSENTHNISADKVLRLKNLVCCSSDLIATRAAVAIKAVSSVLSSSDVPSIRVVLESAVEMSSSSCLQVVMFSARLLREQAVDLSNHSSMLGTEGLLSAMNILCRNHHPSVTHPAIEALNALTRCKIGAVAISKDELLLSALVESVPSASRELQSDISSIVQQTTVQTIIALVMNNDSFAAIVTQRDSFVKILMVLASFGCGKSGKIELRNEAMKAVAQLAEHL